VTFIPNVTGNYTINQYRAKQFLNGYFKLNSKQTINNVSETYFLKVIRILIRNLTVVEYIYLQLIS
jgi:hypothetical protein